MKKLNIIGCGRAARTLSRLWQQAGVFSVGEVLTRNAATAADAASFIGGGRGVALLADMQAAEVWLLGVPDVAIAAACSALAASGLLRPGDAVFHLSGFTPSSALAPASAEGARVAGAHPVLSFADPERTLTQFAGTLIGIEGEASLCAELHTAFAQIGGEGFALSADHKALYHAGAVFAANFLVVIIDTARRLYHESGVAPDVAERLLEPLARKALDNVLNNGSAALTGPAARGDHAVVQAQGQAVADWNGDAGEAYAALSRIAMKMARPSS